MEINALRQSLHQLIDQTEDPELLEAFYKIFTLSPPKDWWDGLEEEAKNLIQEGIQDFENNRLHTHGQVMDEVKDLLKKDL